MSQEGPGFLYAVSWEVCNPGGGVHTVLSTSAPFVDASYGGDVLYVGPDLWAERAAQAAFRPDRVQPPLAALAAERDVPVRFGRWEVEGRPRVALVDFGRLLESKNRILGDLWSRFGVDSIHADWDTVERILFGYAAGTLVELHYHADVRPRALRAVAHFHQWQSAAGLLRLVESSPEIATVYTPHGTALARSMAAEGVSPESVDIYAWAKERGAEARHTLEKAAAKEASVLTVVSDQGVPETAQMLGRRPDLVTPNGYARQAAPGAKHREEVRAALMRAAERFLGTPLDPSKTRVVFTSGRYEFRNKGFGDSLRALGKLARREPRPPRDLLFLIFVSGAQTGPRPDVVRRLKSSALAGESCGTCTHNLARPEEDLILTACRDAGLCNRHGDPVHIIFVPVLLNGRDPVFPYSYTDVLRASDLSLFPSRYEPWGYTPVESLAAGVPTITTDVTGFGRFLLSLPEKERAGVTVLPAGEGLVDAIEEELARFLERSDEEIAALGRAGSQVILRTSWSKLIGATLKAHQAAFLAARSRWAPAVGPGFTGISRRSLVPVEARSEERPRLHGFTVATVLPERIARLREVARNFWWSWNADARALFQALDAEAFAAARGNPIRLLRTVDPDRLEAAAGDAEFVKSCDRVAGALDRYLSAPGAEAPPTGYFCAEYGIHESLPVYSGGLGVLAGDHLKSASDLRLPLTAVGLRYAKGYFVQRIQPDGSQGVEHVVTDLRDTPLEEVNAGDEPLRISITLPEHVLQARVWRAEVGRVQLILLDTLLPQNDAAVQEVTDRLYPSEREHRLRQEILLGIGGWRALKAIGKEPGVCHLNEGHSAFLLLERLIELVEKAGLTFAEAAAQVRASTIFTTHTPVPAGHDRFSEGLMRRYFGHVAQRLGLDWEEFLDLGRASRDDHEFSMTVLALKLSGRANGVSRLHGEVSRRMLANVWPGFHEAETPVGSITNGVHLATWAGTEIDALLEKHLAPRWSREHPPAEEWRRLKEAPAASLWQAHVAQKLRLTEFLQAETERVGLRRGESPRELRKRRKGIDADALWIGFARRFAPYKRAALLFQDPARLEKLLGDTDRPVRVVFSGKSHPDDREGADLVREIVQYTTDARFSGRVFFVEDYGMAAARCLVQGCDIWLNTPTRPLEASGTSGMKAALNGVLHVSILDGWWCEGHNGLNGWAFGEGREYENPEMQLEYDSRSLYSLLETRIVPLFFRRDPRGLPLGWIDVMRESIATIPGNFNTHRMVEEYARDGYRALGERAAALAENEYAGARELARTHATLREAWGAVQIEDLSVTDPTRGSIGVGNMFEVRARVKLGSLSPDAVAVELYVGPADVAGELKDPVVIPLLRDGEVTNGTAQYTGTYLPKGAGSFLYGVRVRPVVNGFQEAAHLGLVRWA